VRGYTRRAMSTASKLWLGFGLLLLFLIAIGLYVSHRLAVTEQALSTIIGVQEPAAALAYEMAMNVSTADAHVLAHVASGDPEHRVRVAANQAEFANLLDQYRRQAPSQMSESLAQRIRSDHAQVQRIGDSLMTLSDEQRALAAQFENRADALRTLLVGGLRARIDLDLRNRDTQRKLAEVTRLEADLNGISAALGLYLINRPPAMRDRIAALASDLRETVGRYTQLKGDDVEQRDLARLSVEFPSLLEIARQTMSRADEVQGARARFVSVAEALESQLDNGIHGLARTDLVDAQDLARRSLNVSQFAVLILIVSCIVIGIVTALPVGFGIVRAERTLRVQMRELAVAHARKDEFLDVLGHELRNPLAPLANSIPILEARKHDVPEDVRRVHVMIERQTRSMKRIVDDLLDVSRINRGKIDLHREPVRIGPLVAQSVEDLRPLAEAQGHSLQVRVPAEPVWVNADSTRFAQIIANLVHNAIKYTPPGDGTIEVVVRAERGDAVVEVIDSGVGIPAPMLSRIFEPFAQVDASLTRSHGGLGIGLTLVDRLARLHGGMVTAASEGEGRGSRFTLRLPRIDAPRAAIAPAPAAPGAPAAADGTRRILVVDDNRDSAESMADLLRLWGHHVNLAFDGNEALARAEQFHPEMVLLDIGLPGMDGYQVADRLRKETDTRGLTLVAITGYGQREDRERALAAGFDHHLTKPVDAEALRSLVARGH